MNVSYWNIKIVSKILPRSLIGIFSFLFLLSSANAIEPFTVKEIRVEGIQRTETSTVLTYLPIKVGEQVNDEKIAAAVKALFATGFFKDVRLEAEKETIVVIVDERPAIGQIDFTGNKEFDKDQLRTGLKQIGISESRIYDRALVDRAEQELKRQYLSRGKYGTTISTTVTPLERNRVSLNFAINEGDVSKIRQVRILGNQAFTEKQLLNLFVLRTPGILTFISKNDQYSKQKLTADLETLRSFYLDRGYLEFNIDSTQVSISSDKKDIFITVSINEGPRYIVSDVKFAGELLVPEIELRSLISVKNGEVFSREKMVESTIESPIA